MTLATLGASAVGVDRDRAMLRVASARRAHDQAPARAEHACRFRERRRSGRCQTQDRHGDHNIERGVTKGEPLELTIDVAGGLAWPLASLLISTMGSGVGYHARSRRRQWRTP
jgi:hypothetical protein